MGRVLVYLGRFLIILVGYALAATAASLFLNVLMLGAIGLQAEESMPFAVGSMFVSVPVLALFTAYFAFIPAFLAILLGEILHKRDWLSYALAGAAVAAIIIGLSRGVATDTHLAADPGFALAIIGSGLVGGIVYWMMAGRSAGRWHEGTQRSATLPGPSGS